MTKGKRMLTHREMEAWLQELPFWRAMLEDRELIGGGRTGPGMGAGGGAPGRVSSPVEAEATDLAWISASVGFLDRRIGRRSEGDTWAVEPTYPLAWVRLVEERYLTWIDLVERQLLAPGQRYPWERVATILDVSESTCYRWREHVLSLLVVDHLQGDLDPGPAYRYTFHRGESPR